MKKINLFGIVLSIVAVNPTAASSLQCNKDNFDACKTCEQLSKAIDLKEPNRGDYYRGALWNGLYASYVINCPVVEFARFCSRRSSERYFRGLSSNSIW
ncbi:hypothetical protein AB0U78_11230, partial [Escherichia coli]